MGYTSDLPVRNYYNVIGGSCVRSGYTETFSDHSIQLIQLDNNNLYCVFCQYTSGLDNTYQLQGGYSSNNGLTWNYVNISKQYNSAYNHYNPYIYISPNTDPNNKINTITHIPRILSAIS